MPIPSDTHVPGDTGHVTDHNAIADVLTALTAAIPPVLTRTAVQTSSYTAAASQVVPCDTTAGPFTVTLPNAPTAGTLLAVKMVTQGGTSTVTIACAGSDVFSKTGGATTLTLTLASQGMLLQYTAGYWTVLADDLPLSQTDLRYAQTANNLSDLASAATARTNLGLPGTATAALPLTIGNGGTGQASQQAALNALAATATSGQYLRGNGTNVLMAAIAAADLPAGTASVQGALQIDGTATDITGPGTQAAGGTGKPADAGHVHPVPFWLPSDNGWTMANGDYSFCASSAVLTAGTMYLAKLPVRQAATITSLWFYVGTAGVGASTQSFAGLYSSAGVLLSGSADIGASMLGTGVSHAVLTTPQAVTAGTFVWAAILTNLATTQPALLRFPVSSAQANLNLAAASYRWGNYTTTSLTALPASFTPGSGAIGASTAVTWVAAS